MEHFSFSDNLQQTPDVELLKMDRSTIQQWKVESKSVSMLHKE